MPRTKQTVAHPVTYRGCYVKPLPDHLQRQGVRIAHAENPANKPAPLAMAALAPMPELQRIAILTTKYWGNGGVKLTVSFLERTAPQLQDKILSHMNAWSEWANVHFSRVDSGGQVRISRGRGGYWSYLGTDVLAIPKGQPTMNLEGFILDTPESEYKRVIRHETGHTLGAPHEHMRKAIVARLNTEATIAYFERTQGWTRQDVIQQVLTPLEESQLLATPQADETSIMTYQLPAEITNDRKPVVGGSDINASDGQFMGSMYPKAGGPTKPLPADGTVTVQVYGTVTKLVVNGKEVVL